MITEANYYNELVMDQDPFRNDPVKRRRNSEPLIKDIEEL